MLMPSIFGENLFDDFFGFGDSFQKFAKTSTTEMMKTDIKEGTDAFEVQISMPGFRKEDIHAELKDGYLTISGSTNRSSEDKNDAKGHYIRRERYSGFCSRSFYVGEQIKQEDIHAKYTDGILTLTVPKIEVQPQVETNKYIAIEG